MDDLLPPFAALKAFRAAAQLGSFRQAARQLSLTESAVSHQIKRLEELLQTQLFVRRGSGTELTPSGRDYFEQIDPALGLISTATQSLLAPTGRPRIVLTLPPSLAINWLIPNLANFEETHPDLDLELIATTRLLNLRQEHADIAIRHGAGPWSDVTSEFLLAESAMPVAQPGYIKDATPDPSRALSDVRLIVNKTFPDEWFEWARARGIEPPSLDGALRLETMDQSIAAAERGLGVAIGRSPVVDPLLEAGTIVAPFGVSDRTGAGYHLCIPNAQVPTSGARRAMNWLRVIANTTATS